MWTRTILVMNKTLFMDSDHIFFWYLFPFVGIEWPMFYSWKTLWAAFIHFSCRGKRKYYLCELDWKLYIYTIHKYYNNGHFFACIQEKNISIWLSHQLSVGPHTLHGKVDHTPQHQNFEYWIFIFIFTYFLAFKKQESRSHTFFNCHF